MIPYLPQPTLSIGGVTFHAFGALVAIGILVGAAVVRSRARRLGIEDTAARRLTWAAAVAGIGGAILSRALFYGGSAAGWMGAGGAPVGLYSFGGMAAGLAGIVWAAWRERSAQRDVPALLDLIAYAFPFGWLFGRLGCFLAHDHRGAYSSNWLAVRFPEGPRYDLGLIEFLFTAGLCLWFWRAGRQPRRAGYFLSGFLVIYGVFRLWLSTLNAPPAGAVDPDPWWAALSIAGGFFWWWSTRAEPACPRA